VTLYVDSSAFLKRYVAEPDSDAADRHLLADTRWICARHGGVEVRRNLARLLKGRALAQAQAAFAVDWARTNVVELDVTTCELASHLAESTGARTLDALHLAAATRVGGAGALSLLTFDVKLGQAARALGFTVLGV
jgi:predicted nucleic acid-binding protein